MSSLSQRQRTLHESFSTPSVDADDNLPRYCTSVCKRQRNDNDYTVYGRGTAGPVSADKADGLVVHCYDCGELMSLVPKQTRSRRGVSWDVRAHFRHPRGIECTGTGESTEHKAAVHAFTIYKFDVFTECKQCRKSMSIVMRGKPCIERVWMHDDRSYRLDVAFVEDNAVVAAVEVWHTHATTGQKLRDLDASEIAWCEVRAEDVHESIRRGDYCVRDATKQWLCQECDEKACNLARDKAYSDHVQSMRRLTQEVTRADADLVEAQLAHAALEQELTDQAERVCEKRDRVRAQSLIAQAALEEELKAQAERIREQCTDAREKRCARKLVAYKEMLSEVGEWAAELQKCAGETDWTDLTTMLASPHMTLTFGKHEGEQLEVVFGDDPAYVVWIAGWGFRQFDGNKPRPHQHPNYRATREQQQSARDMLKGKCLVCFCELDKDWKNRCTSCYHETR
jgi:hypothetical protein